jgi:ssDNA-binding Zn-finger/Zn-ribbon topoisomerase 1
MILRTGAFDPFRGCTRYPRCRGVICEAAPETSVPTR